MIEVDQTFQFFGRIDSCSSYTYIHVVFVYYNIKQVIFIQRRNDIITLLDRMSCPDQK